LHEDLDSLRSLVRDEDTLTGVDHPFATDALGYCTSAWSWSGEGMNASERHGAHEAEADVSMFTRC
jgi:hypothetical protein